MLQELVLQSCWVLIQMATTFYLCLILYVHVGKLACNKVESRPGFYFLRVRQAYVVGISVG